MVSATIKYLSRHLTPATLNHELPLSLLSQDMSARTESPPANWTNVHATDPSNASASSASTHSQDGTTSDTSASAATTINGKLTPAPEDSKRAVPTARPSMKTRISGMFGRKENGAEGPKEPAQASLVQKMKDSTISEQDELQSPVSPAKPPSPTRSPTMNQTPAFERTKTGLDKKADDQQHRRFTMNADGSHEHRLTAQKRTQKLKDMVRNMFDKKKEVNEEQPLTLMADWIAQKRIEDKVATDVKGGPSNSQSLVEKYGRCQEIVGHGAFGIVRVAHKTDAKDPRREQLFAVKEFRQRPGESAKKYKKRLTSEFCISSSMEHPNVIHTLDLLQDDKGGYCEVMEYCAGGDMYTLILAAGNLEVLEADCYFKQLMRGVEYLHEMGVAHRDLKPENLLLTQHGALKITDFGNGECFRMAWEKEAHMTAGLCGSAPYIAPEEYTDREFDPRGVDVWACGIIYMAMRTGRHLWRVAQKGEDEFYTRYLEDRKDEAGFRPIEILRRVRQPSCEVFEQSTNSYLQRQCRNVIYCILDPNAKRRLTAHEVLLSEWVKDINVCKAGDEGF